MLTEAGVIVVQALDGANGENHVAGASTEKGRPRVRELFAVLSVNVFWWAMGARKGQVS